MLVCSGGVRGHVRAIVERFRPTTAVLAQAEIHPRARIRSDRPVRLTLGASRFEAQTLDYDHAERSVRLDGRVRGLIDPAPVEGGGRAER